MAKRKFKEIMNLPKTLTSVIWFSKILAVLLFFIFILAGFYAGMRYQKKIDFIKLSTMQQVKPVVRNSVITVTMENTQPVSAKVEDTITTDFGSSHSWSIRSSDGSILKVVSLHDAKVVGRGTAILSASISPKCNPGMLCPMFIIAFKATIIVN